MKRTSEDGNGSRDSQSRKRQRAHSKKWIDLDVLDFPICYEPFTIPTFQCDIGHVACKFCWPKLKRCPLCALPISNKRCIAMESLLERVFVPCRNSKLDCTKNVPYGRRSHIESLTLLMEKRKVTKFPR